MAKLTFVCKFCDKQYVRDASNVRDNGTSFCSKLCHRLSQCGKDTIFPKAQRPRIRVMMTCAHCGKEFETVPFKKYKGGRKYCSQTCRRIAKRPKVYDIVGLRNTVSRNKWWLAVFKRDSFRCQACGVVGTALNAHHIKPLALYPEYAFDIDNGVTLCKSCHILVHKVNGKPKCKWGELQERPQLRLGKTCSLADAGNETAQKVQRPETEAEMPVMSPRVPQPVLAGMTWSELHGNVQN